jgi:hypothetical protein
MTQPARRSTAPEPRRAGWFWSRLHFLIRFLGLTGFLGGCAGLLLAGLAGLLNSWSDVYESARNALQTGEAEASTWLILGGAAAVAFALLVELLVVVRFFAGRRSAFGLNAALQVALAVALVVGFNAWSFSHHLRFDWTRDGQFTLPPPVRAELMQLAAGPDTKTTVVVYQRHKTFGALTDKPDRFDYAAERKVVEKVKDLVEQFRELGQRFDVEVLDVEEEGFDDHLAALTRDAPELRKAIDRAPENSIFLYANGRVQQMSFNEFYLLDRVASQTDNGNRGNLVLLAQGAGPSGRGVEPFARKVLNLEERRPRVGVLVMHEYLTTEGAESAFTLRGLRRALEVHGFDVRDVVLRRFPDTGPEPAADTADESKLERLDADLDDLDAEVKALRTEIKNSEAEGAEWELKPGEKEKDRLDRLSQLYARSLRGHKLTSAERQMVLARFRSDLERLREFLTARRRERDEVRAERSKLNVNELQEAHRMRDVKAKLDRALADCDLLLIPRLTRRANGSLAAPYRFHRLSDAQLASVREFMSAGKPVLACLGPASEPPELGLPPDTGPADGFDSLLADLGIHLNKQTILFSADSKAFADRRLNPFRADDMVRVPALDFESGPEAWAGRLSALSAKALPPNPIREGLRVLAHSVGKPAAGGEVGGLDIAIRFPRPVYYEPHKGVTPRDEPVFLVTAEGWNDDRPFPSRDFKPHFERPKKDDPANGTPEGKRRGEFPVGVAVEAPVPAAWSSGTPATAPAVRVAVIGQGDVFVGEELSPARERLFLQTANWLLGRGDYLPRADHPWKYPRVDMTPGSREEQLWLWGTRLGLPALFFYLGLVVLLVRRLR